MPGLFRDSLKGIISDVEKINKVLEETVPSLMANMKLLIDDMEKEEAETNGK